MNSKGTYPSLSDFNFFLKTVSLAAGPNVPYPSHLILNPWIALLVFFSSVALDILFNVCGFPSPHHKPICLKCYLLCTVISGFMTGTFQTVSSCSISVLCVSGSALTSHFVVSYCVRNEYPIVEYDIIRVENITFHFIFLFLESKYKCWCIGVQKTLLLTWRIWKDFTKEAIFELTLKFKDEDNLDWKRWSARAF